MSVVEVILKLKDGATPALKSVKGAADDTSKSMQGASKSGGGFVVTLGDVAGAARLAGQATFGVAQEIADLRNELTDMSTRTGVASGTLAGLKLAAEGSGLQLSEFNEALGQLPKKMSDIAKGGGEAKDAFKALGVDATDSSGKLRDADTVFRELVSGLQSVEDPTTRASLAVQLFGESGGKLMQALGSSELESFVEFSRVFGADVGPQASKAAADWQRSMAELTMVFDGFKAGLVDFFGGSGAIGNFTLGIITAGTFLNGFFGGLFEGIAMEFNRFVTYMTGQVANFVKILNAMKGGDVRAAMSALADGFGQLGGYVQGGDPMSNVLKSAGDRAMADVNAIVPAFIQGRAAMGTAGAGSGGGSGGGAAIGTGKPRGETADAPVFVDIDMSEDLAEMAKIVETRTGGRDFAGEYERELRQKAYAQAGKGMDAAGMAMGGDIAGLAGMAGGPAGMAASQGIALLQQLGAVGAEGVKDQIKASVEGVIAGIRELPELISEVLPELLGELIPDLVMALIEAIPALVVAQYELLYRLMTQLPGMLAEAFTMAILDAWEKLKEAVRQLFLMLIPGRQKGENEREGGGLRKGVGTLLRIGAAIATVGLSEVGIATAKGIDRGLEGSGKKGLPGFATGGHVSADGVYRLHRNEHVVAANGFAPSTALGRGGGGGGGINIYGPVYGGNEGKRALIRELQQMLGAGGLGEALGG